MGTLTLADAPHINHDSLKLAGFTDAELAKIEASLPGMFELSFAFSPWTIGAETLGRLGIAQAQWEQPGFNLLQRLGFTKKQIDQANDVICGRGTVEALRTSKTRTCRSSIAPTSAASTAIASSPSKGTSG